MSFQKYLQTINTINPGKIYVENVRSFLKVSTFYARLLCELAVQDRVFEKKIGIVCPNPNCNRVLKEFSSEKDIPETITCSICESNDEEEFVFKTANLKKVKYYKLRK